MKVRRSSWNYLPRIFAVLKRDILMKHCAIIGIRETVSFPCTEKEIIDVDRERLIFFR